MKPKSHRKLPITAIIPTRNEELNIKPCLESLGFCDQVIVVDSGSQDTTLEIAGQYGAEVHQFEYTGGWPKKRQWAMENLEIRNGWTLLIDADERVTRRLRKELASIIRNPESKTGYWITLRLVFMGHVLKHGASGLKKLAFFQTGKGRFECLFFEQDQTMADMEIHEHLIIDGDEGECKSWLLHENVNSLYRYIQKHNEYSQWSAKVAYRRRRGINDKDSRQSSLTGAQADRRRALMNRLWRLPAAGLVLPILRFFYFYILCLGFLDGKPGFYYCGFKAVQAFHIMAKVHEMEVKEGSKTV